MLSHSVRLELRDKKLAELSTCGIAVHHAGLDYADRRAIEDGFRDGKLHMIASTSVSFRNISRAVGLTDSCRLWPWV